MQEPGKRVDGGKENNASDLEVGREKKSQSTLPAVIG